MRTIVRLPLIVTLTVVAVSGNASMAPLFGTNSNSTTGKCQQCDYRSTFTCTANPTCNVITSVDAGISGTLAKIIEAQLKLGTGVSSKWTVNGVLGRDCRGLTTPPPPATAPSCTRDRKKCGELQYYIGTTCGYRLGTAEPGYLLTCG